MLHESHVNPTAGAASGRFSWADDVPLGGASCVEEQQAIVVEMIEATEAAVMTDELQQGKATNAVLRLIAACLKVGVSHNVVGAGARDRLQGEGLEAAGSAVELPGLRRTPNGQSRPS